MKRTTVIMPIILLAIILSLTFSVIPRSPKTRHTRARKVRREKVLTEAERGVMMALSPPELSLPLNVNAVAGQEVTFTVAARGKGNEAIELQAGNVRNGHLSELHDGMATYSFTPDESQVGAAFVIFTAKDEHGLATSLATKINVVSAVTAASTNQPPAILPPTVSEFPAPQFNGQVSVNVTNVEFSSQSLPQPKKSTDPVKNVAAPTDSAVTSSDVIAAGSKGLVTVDVKTTQPDKGIVATENLPPVETKNEVKSDAAVDTKAVKTNDNISNIFMTDKELRSRLQKTNAENSAGSSSTTSTTSEKIEGTRSENASSPVKAQVSQDVVLTPMAGETFNAGEQVMLAWFAPEMDHVAEQEIQLSTDGGKTFDVVIDPHVPTGIQFFNWTVPNGVDTQNAKIRIAMRDAFGVETDTDSSEFSIKAGVEKSSVSLLNLNGNETLVGGRSFNVRWKTDGMFQPLGYDLTLVIGTKQFVRIPGEIASDAVSFTWNVPNNINTHHARVQLNAYNIAGQPIPVMSTGEFNIVPEPSIGTIDLTTDLEPIGNNLVLKGTGFVGNDSILELNGTAFTPSFGKTDKQGITDRMNLKIDDLDKLLPMDTIVTVTVLNRSTGIRSLPYLYMRQSQ